MIDTYPRASASYPAWDFMLEVDAVNYSVDEQTAVSGRATIANLASGINHQLPPSSLSQTLVRAASDPRFIQDYDGYEGDTLARRSIALGERLRAQDRLAIDEGNVLVTHGAGAAMHLLSLHLRRVPRRGGIVLPVPTFPLAGAAFASMGLRIHEVTNRAAPGLCLPSAGEVLERISSDTVAIYLNIFNNPTGESYTSSDIARIISAAKAANALVIVDRVSADMARVTPAPDVLTIAAEENYLSGVVSISSLSKERSMPGIRVGWIIADAPLVKELARQNSVLTMSSPTLAGALLFVEMLCRCLNDTGIDMPADQVLALFVAEAVDLFSLWPHLRSFVEDFVSVSIFGLAKEHEVWREELAALLEHNWFTLRNQFADVFYPTAEWIGDFNTFVRVPAIDRVNALQFTHELFRTTGIQILPGPTFGLTNHMWREVGFSTRLSFALDPEVWEKGLGRLCDYVGQ